MAQTGFTPIQLYSSSTATNVPLAANLATGELAINITDGKLFYKDNTAAVQVIGWKTVPATAGGTGQTSYAVGDLLYADTTTTLAKLADVATGNALISGGVGVAPSWGKIGLTTHVSGTLGTGNGGTNLTSFTSGGVVYASSTSALATGSVLSFDGTNLGVGTSSPSTFGKIVSYSTAAASANIALTKADSGTANQNGQTLYFNNSHAAATGRNANVVAGNIQWQFSQPSSGALQYAGEIAVLSDAQGGASTASSLNLYSSGGLGLTINSSANTVVAGSLSKASGSFRIDHPLPELEETHQLVHSFIEGPQADLIYRGKVNLVNGTATVNIDTVSKMTEGTFVTLCRDVQCFTTNESDWTAVRGSVTGNILTIEAQDDTSTASISWMVIGERKDKHMMDTDWTDDNGKVIVEPLKNQSATA